MRTLLALAVTALMLSPASSQTTAEIDGVTVEFAPYLSGLDQPVFLTSPVGDTRQFIVEQPGRIQIVADGAVQSEPFLDITTLIASGGERGLLGLAFHPDFAGNGRFFVDYTDLDGNTQIAEYASADGVADPASAKILLSVDQPFANHNGGWIAFGPTGLLYVGMGDGGSGGDPLGNGQNSNAQLGKLLTIDVDSGAVETFAKGVRNPWRNAFDGTDLYVADVGQSAFEEINVIPAEVPGANLGWNFMEGDQCNVDNAKCAGLTRPIYTYDHNLGCSITGGYVYRGEAIPKLDGRYFFADYCTGGVGSLRYADGAVLDVAAPGSQFEGLGSITSFGLDASGELYVLTQDGVVLKLVPSE